MIKLYASRSFFFSNKRWEWERGGAGKTSWWSCFFLADVPIAFPPQNQYSLPFSLRNIKFYGNPNIFTFYHVFVF